MTQSRLPVIADWEQFVVTYGWRAHGHELAAIVGRAIHEVERLRRCGACKRLPKAKRFSELFSLWHGRMPVPEEWPAPRKTGARGTYEWQEPEVVLLAGLVGRLGIPQIAQTLTNRLRQRTGDSGAQRTTAAVQVRVNKIGMQSKDVIGGITTSDAGRQIRSLAIIHHAIRKKQLPVGRVGRRLVIPHAAWKTWQDKRVFPPAGYILLSSIREALSIRSDKLSEFARMGYIPTARRCNPFGTQGPSTQFGTWYIDNQVADKLLADRRAGLPMPWHGKPILDNLRVTYRLWKARQHPLACKTCREIWGKKGAPRTFEDYLERYPPLAHGAKRHLTHKWNPGMSIAELAAYAGRSAPHVRSAISSGMLEVTREGARQYISRTDATRWRARRCPTGHGEKSWVTFVTARKLYLFTLRELRSFIAHGRLKSKIGTNGPMRGVVYVCKHQCGKLRERIGFTEEQAARRVGVTIPRLRKLIEGLSWRTADGIPLATVQAAIKRLTSREGYTIKQAATAVGEPVQWVLDRVREGIIKMSCTKWDRRRVYISELMLRRLQSAKQNPVKQERLDTDWLRLGEAAFEAGVTSATIISWAKEGELSRRQSKGIWRYPRDAVRARARSYWHSVRFTRADPPEWVFG